MDGNYSRTLPARIEACDAIVLLNPPRLVCLWGVFWRSLRYRNRARPDLPAGCPEQLNWEFLIWVWNYSRRSLPKVEAVLDQSTGSKCVLRLESRTRAAEVLAELERRAGAAL
jgi:adenylate kinase family enzyme